MIRADLHVHTYYSDGLFSPADVAKHAAYAPVNALAVTDHDNMLAFDEVKAELEKRGVAAIRGIEISAYHKDVKIHTLGYNLNPDCPEYVKFYEKLYSSSLERTEDILSKLKKCGVEITMDEVLRVRYSDKTPVHVMHIANACTKKGYAATAGAFFFKYLSYGMPAFSNICRPAPEEALNVIKAAGGISSVAHPGRISMDKAEKEAYICRLASAGLDGIECVYSTHTNEETAYFKGLSAKLGLYVTGGSDTHYVDGRREIGRPEFYLSPALEERLLGTKNY